MGNLLVVPIEDSLLYVQPLYLESEQTQLPQLKRVIVFYRTPAPAGSSGNAQQIVAMRAHAGRGAHGRLRAVPRYGETAGPDRRPAGPNGQPSTGGGGTGAASRRRPEPRSPRRTASSRRRRRRCAPATSPSTAVRSRPCRSTLQPAAGPAVAAAAGRPRPPGRSRRASLASARPTRGLAAYLDECSRTSPVLHDDILNHHAGAGRSFGAGSKAVSERQSVVRSVNVVVLKGSHGFGRSVNDVRRGYTRASLFAPPSRYIRTAYPR